MSAILDPSDIVDAIREITYRADYSNSFTFDLSHAGAIAMIETHLDLIWENVNALGGVPANDIEKAQNDTIGKCLAIIESFGGSDPAPKRARSPAIPK